MNEKIFLAQLICYSGDGVLFTKVYRTSSEDSISHISAIFDEDLKNSGWENLGFGIHPVITEIKIEDLV